MGTSSTLRVSEGFGYIISSGVGSVTLIEGRIEAVFSGSLLRTHRVETSVQVESCLLSLGTLLRETEPSI